MKKPTVIFFLIFVSLISISMGISSYSDQAASKKETIRIPGTAPSGLPFSPAVKFGDLLFLSGVVGTDPETGELVSPDIGEQTKQCLELVGLILRQAKMNFSDVVSCTVYLADLSDYTEMNKAYAAYFPEDPPARACIQVAALVRGAKVEISMIAAK
jgi:2-iminobutanoate/2-iminopropanoate deaminase